MLIIQIDNELEYNYLYNIFHNRCYKEIGNIRPGDYPCYMNVNPVKQEFKLVSNNEASKYPLIFYIDKDSFYKDYRVKYRTYEKRNLIL